MTGRFMHNCAMSNVVKIHAGKQPRRPHYIEAWADRRGLKQADLARELAADKSLVSRWYGGATPSERWQQALADLFNCEPDSLFRHPDDDWLSRFFRDRPASEVEKIKSTLEILFPKAS
jgi:transcriptional regulator with XRE-family HTH domain